MRRPNPQDRKIERAIAQLLDGKEGSGIEKTDAKTKLKKGDHRNIVTMDELELVVFGRVQDPLKTFGRNKNRYSRAIGDPNGEWKSVDMVSSADEKSYESTAGEEELNSSESEDDREHNGGAPLPGVVKISKARIRPPQTESELNFSAMGGERSKAEKIEESPADLEKRREGQRRAEEREMVRRAARRAVIFGVEVDEDWREPTYEPTHKKGHKKSSSKEPIVEEKAETAGKLRRKCEAVMQGQVVEPSYAKGNWSIRWRERE